ncbi:DUF6629 family protein [Thermoleptolyngbya sp. C42_A2020_037]|uniref:DUF6629 family protein n=1 Tax=Thermoleptolyngbya sp. C42_A2020_037 TaxID=2747799 RepID=UPI00345C22A4
MCFSATASFSLGATLIPVGVACIKRAQEQDKRYMPLAAFPLAFGIQQVIEGLVWVGLGANNTRLVALAAAGFVCFSHGFWLVWTPLTAASVESDRPRWQVWRALAGLGFLYGLYFNLPIWLEPQRLSVSIHNHSLVYQLQLLMEPTRALSLFGYTLYVLTILAPMLLSGDRHIQRLGGLVLVALLFTANFFSAGFISVWCFFAALVSLYVGYVFLQGLEPRSQPPLA